MKSCSSDLDVIAGMYVFLGAGVAVQLRQAEVDDVNYWGLG
jgi:hypothetical protein